MAFKNSSSDFTDKDHAYQTKFRFFEMINLSNKDQAQILDNFCREASLEGVHQKYGQYLIKWISFALPPAFFQGRSC